MTIEQMIAEQKKKVEAEKKAGKPVVEIEILDQPESEDEEVVSSAGPSERTRSRSDKSKNTTVPPARVQ